MKKPLTKRHKGFTLIELIVVIAVIGILVLVAMPKLLDYTREAKIAQIKHDVKVAEEVMEVYLIEHDGLPESPVDIETPLAKKRLWETRGLVESIQGDPGDYMDITGLEAIKDAKSKLDGQFVANDMGKVYYIADKVIEVGDSGQEDGDGTESGPILCSAIPNDEWRPTDIPWDATIVGSGAAMDGDDLTLEQLNNAYFGLPKEDAAHYTFNGVNYLGTEDYIISSTLLLTEYFIEMSLLGEYTPEEIITFGLTTQERLNAALALIEGLNSIDFNPTYTATYNEDGEIVDGSCQPIVVIDFTQLDSEMLQYENLEGNSSIYTDETWNDYTVAYNEALEIDENNSQEEVDAATSNLRAARESLIEKADLTDYNDLLGSVNEGDYSSESWDTYIEVVNSNQVTQGSSQAEIDNAIANISNAQSNLIPKDINEDYFDYIISNGEVEITNLKYVGKLHFDGNLVIPSTIYGFPVTTIGESAFSGDALISVEMPDTLVTIKQSAFVFNEFSSVTIPDSVTTIGAQAFNGVWQLKELNLGSSVKTIGQMAFYACGITDITIPDSVISIGDSAFAQNGSMGKPSIVIIGNSVKTIGVNAFKGSNISSLDLGNSVEEIGKEAFNGNKLTSLVIPDSVISIGDLAFFANDLTSVVIGKSVNSIGTGVFAVNTGLWINVNDDNDFYMDYEGGLYTKDGLTILSGSQHQANNMLSGLEIIERNAFYKNGLTTVTIPNSVTEIGNSAFYQNRIETLTFGPNLTFIGDNAFRLNGPSGTSNNISTSGPWAGTWELNGNAWTKQ